ncbi:sensor histidine kinase [Acetivibrio cellulolyticus]|uniref:sensor histidine kinase n=1 Tax=Acetivibrio cellulolyticus TaxID=35830 RepID=UPI0001E2D916
MKRNTMKWRIFKYNIIIIVGLIALTTIVFNIAIRFYIEGDIKKQLSMIAQQTEYTALHKGPDFFPIKDKKSPPPPPDTINETNKTDIDLLGFHFMLDHSLREPLSILNANYILLDNNKEVIPSPSEDYFSLPENIVEKVTNEIGHLKDVEDQKYINFTINGTEYISIIKPISNQNSIGLGWLVIYSTLQKVNQLKLAINAILLVILVLSALIVAVFSSIAAKKISAPFSSLSKHIGAIAERNFGTKIDLPVDDELQEFVININTMSEKLESYDKAQKTFLQNASHEFRTPLMSIQSYAEGIKYDVVEKDTAADIIIDETKRMTHLVEDLLYLSRLDAIEENYHYNALDFNDFINTCKERMNGIAIKSNISLIANSLSYNISIYADEDKLFRAFTNIISNCIRYANNTVEIKSQKLSENQLQITICDDGPGIDAKELPNIFERFYKGKKGNVGLGLAISKNVIEKHNGKITAHNSQCGAIFTIILPIK